MIVLALVACATRPPAGPPPLAGWRSALGREHPLAGRIWDSAGARFVTAEALVGRLTAARFVLLGEKHDNPDHHALQVWVLRALLAAGRRPAVAFEMLTPDQETALARHLAGAPDDVAGIASAVGWARSGWPAWSLYAPLFETAVRARLPVAAANLTSAQVRALLDGRSLDPTLAARLGLDRPLDGAAAAAMTQEIREAHCGTIPESRLAVMVAVQRARDAVMAARLVERATDGGAVLVAGAGHVHRDGGVPVHLVAGAAGATVAGVGFVEVQDGEPRVPDYRAPFDYVWFTPRLDDDDPCRGLREKVS
ncbi:MAG: ChaN family lipoprotein [Candidatus Rokubacteria bacterium]|nr:ChaN family lipoprotein [Candidatus Rokubacteria bacterium]